MFVVADIGIKRLEVVQKMMQIPMGKVILVDSASFINPHFFWLLSSLNLMGHVFVLFAGPQRTKGRYWPCRYAGASRGEGED